MRMWMIYPVIMCWNHLNGEHAEHHMFLGTIRKGISIQGYLYNNLLEPSSLIVRHNQLAKEMYRRKRKEHQSPFNTSDDEIESLMSKEQYNTLIDKENSLITLLQRCDQCRRRVIDLFLFSQQNDILNILPLSYNVLQYL